MPEPVGVLGEAASGREEPTSGWETAPQRGETAAEVSILASLYKWLELVGSIEPHSSLGGEKEREKPTWCRVVSQA